MPSQAESRVCRRSEGLDPDVEVPAHARVEHPAPIRRDRVRRRQSCRRHPGGAPSHRRERLAVEARSVPSRSDRREFARPGPDRHAGRVAKGCRDVSHGIDERARVDARFGRSCGVGHFALVRRKRRGPDDADLPQRSQNVAPAVRPGQLAVGVSSPVNKNSRLGNGEQVEERAELRPHDRPDDRLRSTRKLTGVGIEVLGEKGGASAVEQRRRCSENTRGAVAQDELAAGLAERCEVGPRRLGAARLYEEEKAFPVRQDLGPAVHQVAFLESRRGRDRSARRRDPKDRSGGLLREENVATG